MPRLPTVNARKLIKVLKRSGFVLSRTEGSHHIFYHPKKKIPVSVPVHKGRDLGRGLTKSLLKTAEISDKEFLKLV